MWWNAFRMLDMMYDLFRCSVKRTLTSGPWMTCWLLTYFLTDWLTEWLTLVTRCIFNWCSGHRFEDNPGMRRHLVKKSSRAQITRTSVSSLPMSSLKKTKPEKKIHEVSSARLSHSSSPVASKIQEIKSIEKNAHMNKKGPIGIKCNKEKYTYALDI